MSRTRKKKTNEAPSNSAVIYARYSSNNQREESIDAQVRACREYAQAHGLNIVNVYADSAKTGTNDQREAFQQMLADSSKGIFSTLIIHKLDRFSRDRYDSAVNKRLLRKNRCRIVSVLEHLDDSPESAIMEGVIESFSEYYSKNLSREVKKGQKETALQCKHNGGKPPLGYDVDKDTRKCIINEKEAEIVRLIFSMYAKGCGYKEILRHLNAMVYRTKKGNQFANGSLNNILKNEKYIGDALLQKTYTVDFLTKKRVKNNGIVPQYYVENSHEPIIPKDIYMQVQEEMVRRGNLNSGNKKRVYSSRYAMSGIVYCGKCGDIYRRIAWNNRGKRSIVWRCVSRVEHGPSSCDAPTILETDLQAAVVKAINLVLADRDKMLKVLQENIETVLQQEGKISLTDIDAKLESLQKELLQRANGKVAYNDIADEIYRLRKEKQNALAGCAQREGLKQRIGEMTEFLNGQIGKVEEYDEQLVRFIVEKVIIFEGKLVVEFKPGLETKV